MRKLARYTERVMPVVVLVRLNFSAAPEASPLVGLRFEPITTLVTGSTKV